MFQEPQKRRNYIIYILFIFLSGSIFLVDLFSNKKFSNLISDNTDFLFPVSQEAIGFFESLELNIMKNKNTLINENIRLKNEVIELRKLKLINERLVEEIRSNKLPVAPPIIKEIINFPKLSLKTTKYIK